MFSQACVIHSVCVCVCVCVSQHAIGQGAGCVYQYAIGQRGVCDQGGVDQGGVHPPLVNKRVVYILLECFLVVVILTEALNLKISYF